MILDSVNVWHVSKAGNDANGGHAQQYPVGLAADAKLTIAAAVAAAAAGDTVIVWPGTYTEAITLPVALNLVGVNKQSCIINSTTANVPLTIGAAGSGSRISDLSCVSSGGRALALSVITKTVELININIFCTEVASYAVIIANVNNVSILFKDCQISSIAGCVTTSNVLGAVVYDRCSFYCIATTATGNVVMMYFYSGANLFNNCSFRLYSGATNTTLTRTLLQGDETRISILNSSLYIETAEEDTGDCTLIGSSLSSPDERPTVLSIENSDLAVFCRAVQDGNPVQNTIVSIDSTSWHAVHVWNTYYDTTKTVGTALVNQLTGAILGATGLDTITVTSPTGLATTFPGMVVQLWRRFFKKCTATSTQLKTYTDADGVNTTQTVSYDGTTKTVGGAS